MVMTAGQLFASISFAKECLQEPSNHSVGLMENNSGTWLCIRMRRELIRPLPIEPPSDPSHFSYYLCH